MAAKTDQERHEAGEIHPDAGVAHGHVDANGEEVVYIHDDAGNYVEWAKKPAGGFKADKSVRPRNEEQ